MGAPRCTGRRVATIKKAHAVWHLSVPKACHTGFVAVPGAGIQILLAHGASATVPAMTGHLPFLFTIHGGTGGMAVLKDS